MAMMGKVVLRYGDQKHIAIVEVCVVSLEKILQYTRENEEGRCSLFCFTLS
jgi:hypothetical protein